MNKPDSVKNAEKLLYCSLGIGIVLKILEPPGYALGSPASFFVGLFFSCILSI